MVNMMVRFKYSLALAVEEIIKEKIFTEVFFFFSFPILGIIVIIRKQFIENIDVFLITLFLHSLHCRHQSMVKFV